MRYHIFTDGACSKNPGPGGWAVVVMNEEENQIIFSEYDTDDYTTNNRMELQAMICALHYALERPEDTFIIYSDSAYVVNSINSWQRSWAANGWRNSKKQTVENLEQQKYIYELMQSTFFPPEVRKCDGHTGDLGNELADALATRNTRKWDELIETWDIASEELEARNRMLGNWNGANWFPLD